MIDLRSDTCSRPTPEMRQAIANADVGDDVYGDDPTVKALERTVADLLGKEDAVYMPTGTMTNQVAIRAHTEHGDAVLFDQNAHVYILEGGAPAAFSGVLPRLLPGVRGIFRAADVDAAMGTSHPFFPATVAAPVPCYVWRTPTTSAAARSGHWRRSRRSPPPAVGTNWRSTSMARACGTPPRRPVRYDQRLLLKGLGGACRLLPIGNQGLRRPGAPLQATVRRRLPPSRNHRRRRALCGPEPPHAAARHPCAGEPLRPGAGADRRRRDRSHDGRDQHSPLSTDQGRRRPFRG